MTSLFRHLDDATPADPTAVERVRVVARGQELRHRRQSAILGGLTAFALIAGAGVALSRGGAQRVDGLVVTPAGEPSPTSAPTASESPSPVPAEPTPSPTPSEPPAPTETAAPAPLPPSRPSQFYGFNPRGIGVYRSHDGALIRDILVQDKPPVVHIEYHAASGLLYYTDSPGDQAEPRRCDSSVWQLDPRSGEKKLLLRSRPNRSIGELALSPEGNFLAYVEGICAPDAGRVAMVLRDLRSGDERRWDTSDENYRIYRPVVGLNGHWVAFGRVDAAGTWQLARLNAEDDARTLEHAMSWPGMDRSCGQYGSSWGWGRHTIIDSAGETRLLASCGSDIGLLTLDGRFRRLLSLNDMPDGTGDNWYPSDIEVDVSGRHVLFVLMSNHSSASYAWSPGIGFTLVDQSSQVQWGGDGDWLSLPSW